jgi:hypothetical protein
MDEKNVDILFPIGKHKGEPIAKVIEDSTYCKWLLKQAWFAKQYPKLQKIIIIESPKPVKIKRKKVKHKAILYVKSNPLAICLN